MEPTHRLVLRVAPGPIVLERVVTTCRARQCPVVSLAFDAGCDGRPGRITATIAASERRARFVAARLATLVEVLDVLEVTEVCGLEAAS